MTKYCILPMIIIIAACSQTERSYSEAGGGACETCDATTPESGGSGSITTTSNTSGASTTGGSATESSIASGGSSEISTGSTAISGGSTFNTSVVTGGSSSSTTICIPKTCVDLMPVWSATTSKLSKPTICGLTTDGCGGVISCGTCVTDGTTNIDCGQAPPTACPLHTTTSECLADTANVCNWSTHTNTCYGGWDWTGNGLLPAANICGSRCIKNPDGPGGCSNGSSGWICPSTLPPLGITGCNIINLSAHTWCCDS